MALDPADRADIRQTPPKGNPTLGPTDAPAAVGPSTGNPSAKPSGGDCGAGSGKQPQDQSGGGASDPGAASPGSCGQVIQNQSGIRSLPISNNLKNILSSSAQSINANFVVTSGGQPTIGTSSNRTGSTRHDNTSGQLGAADGYFTDCTTGAILRGGNPADRTRLAQGLGNAYQQGATGLGTNYMTSFSVPTDAVHHIGGGTDRIWGGDNELLSAAKQGRTPAAKQSGGGPSQGGGKGNPCNGGGGGCAPISSAAPAAAASMAKGLGMAPAAALTQGLGAIAQTGLGGLQGALQGAIGQAAGMLSGVAGLSSITQMGSQLLGSVGAGIMPSLTGMIPSIASSVLGGGSLTGMIQSVAGQIIGAGLPQLGGFNQILQSAVGAAASGGNIANAIAGSAQQVFGNAVGKQMSSLVGTDVAGLVVNKIGFPDGLEGPEGMDDFSNFSNKLSKSVGLVGPVSNVLAQGLETRTMNAFSSLYNDYQSFVTQGMGNLTDHMTGLGRDLYRLGQIGDMKDLINVGTPHQLARQLIENGFGVSSGLLFSLQERGLTPITMYDRRHNDLLTELLKDINDPALIKEIKTKFNIAEELNITNVADLLKPEVVFLDSDQYNRFTNINDMVMQLAMCTDNSRALGSLGNLGELLFSLEGVEYYDELLRENFPLRPTEFYELEGNPLIQSKFNTNGPTVADFIGTAAGYVHGETLPAMAQLYGEISDHSALGDFRTLMQTLTETISGTYTDEALQQINVPGVGIFTTLDDAIKAVTGAIEAELSGLKDTLPTSDPDLWARIQYLETAYHESANFMAHEKTMRRQYGIDIGEPQRSSTFTGDGSTATFKLEEDVSTNHLVYVDGSFQTNWTYNRASNSIHMASAPAAGKAVTVSYRVNTIKPTPMPTDAWQLASSLEDLGTQTGFGNPADFLRRITTDDVHGQRIQAIMIQARNRQKFENWGLSCPGYNQTVDASGDTDVNFVDQTGFWTADANRAGEIWLQNTQGVNTTLEYVVKQLMEKKEQIQPDLDVLMENVMRQNVFFVGGNLVVSDQFVAIYEANTGDEIYNEDRSDLAQSYAPYPDEGYILGPFAEIMTAIMSAEKLSSTRFQTPMSPATEQYLKKIGVDIARLTTLMQRVLSVTAATHLGITEDDVTNIFGVISVSKNILQNVANNV